MGPVKSAESVAEEALKPAGAGREKAVKKVIATHTRFVGASPFVHAADRLGEAWWTSGERSGMDVDGTGERNETEAQRIDRNWIELLQELRIVQTGGQVLTGFLLMVPFQDRFAEISGGARALYLAILALALVSTVILLAPVMIHRAVFRQHRKDRVLRWSGALARVGLAILAVAMVGLVALIFTLVLSAAWGFVAGAVMAAFVTVMHYVVPARLRSRAATNPYA